MQLAMHMVTIEDLMPREHFLRKLEAALDLSFVTRKQPRFTAKNTAARPLTRWSS